ncbi:hypothetical protein K438DRAFT_1780779 [Mycena galopus ATCC 62051]|nr:hypothetical protein K438DRAFT_1780779 [Mycena galopus ATCC 62051]
MPQLPHQLLLRLAARAWQWWQLLKSCSPAPSSSRILPMNVWVRVTNVKTPAQVEAQHASAPNDCAWYVVWVGREPSIYITSEEADAQIKGCPGQQYHKPQSKPEALALYRDKFCDRQVSKWAEC